MHHQSTLQFVHLTHFINAHDRQIDRKERSSFSEDYRRGERVTNESENTQTHQKMVFHSECSTGSPSCRSCCVCAEYLGAQKNYIYNSSSNSVSFKVDILFFSFLSPSSHVHQCSLVVSPSSCLLIYMSCVVPVFNRVASSLVFLVSPWLSFLCSFSSLSFFLYAFSFCSSILIVCLLHACVSVHRGPCEASSPRFTFVLIRLRSRL